MNNVTIVEVINHNQVFNFNQMDQVLSHLVTNHHLPQTSSESLMNSPRASRSGSLSEYSVASPRHSNRHQTRNTSAVEESINDASRSYSHSESNDRTTNGNDVPAGSTSEMPNESQRIKVRANDPEDGRLRRRPKRHEVVLPATDPETASNYEHLVLPTAAVQSRPSPNLSNFVPTDITLLPTRPQVRFNY